MNLKIQPLDTRELNAEAYYLLFFASTLFVFEFAPKEFFSLIHCPFKMLTHLPCPTCGMTRTALLMQEGHFAQAFSVSFLFPILYFSALLFALYSAAVLLFRLPRIRLSNTAIRTQRILAALFCFIVLCNWIISVVRHI